MGEEEMTKLTCVRTKHNPEQTYEEFKEERLKGWGSSDIGSLLNEGEWACQRRLFLERLGLMPPEAEDRLAFHRERGKFFEAPVASLYASRTGREVRQIGVGYIKEMPFIRANADRLVQGHGLGLDDRPRGWGCLEIKCPAQWSFKKIQKEGLPKEYILQLQWQMLCYGVSWGSFAVYWPDGHELLWFDVERDEELIQGLIVAAEKAWAALDDLRNDVDRGNAWQHSMLVPDRIDIHSKACQKCPQFETCHGIPFKDDAAVIVNNELESDAARYLELKSQAKAIEKETDALKDKLRSEFASCFPCDYISTGRHKIKVSERTRESLSSKVKEVLTPEQLAYYTSTTKYEQIDVKELK